MERHDPLHATTHAASPTRGPTARGEAVRLKMQLQRQGVRMEDGGGGRSGGAGPADGVTLVMEGLTAHVPTNAPYVRHSPYQVRGTGESRLLYRDGQPVCEVKVAGPPQFYSQSTSDGVPMRSVALRHGRDAIGSTVAQSCIYGDRSCIFCGISQTRESGDTITRKSPSQLAEVAVAAEREGFRHMVLTTGTTDPYDRGIGELSRCAAAVKQASGLRVHVQFEPPQDPGLIDMIACHADSVAINAECFDRWVLEWAAPGKAATTPFAYVEAWRRAVEAFGPGQVTSFVLLGLGESAYSVLEGCRLLTALGVYPYLVPLRPLPGTPLAGWTPPDVGEVRGLYECVATMVQNAGLRASDCLAGCVRCGACSCITDLTG